MIRALTGVRGKVTYSEPPRHLAERPDQRGGAGVPDVALKDPLYPEFLKLQPTGTTRVIFTPAVQEALYQGCRRVFTGSKTPKQVMEDGRSGLEEGR